MSVTKFRVGTLNNISTVGLRRFKPALYDIGALDSADSNIEDPNAVMLRSFKLSVDHVPNSVQAIARCGAGTNNIDVKGMTSRGIPVFNTPGANANSVKELVLCGMLLSARGIHQGINHVQRIADTEGVDVAVGNVEKDKKLFAGSEIKGKTLGLIGMGAIGGQVAAAARALGMSVVGYDPALSVQAAFDLPGDRITRVTSLGAVAAAADYISLHAPLIKGVTEGIVGPAIDALLQAYQDGKYKGMYITDFPEERLQGHENVISIPHLGASTAEAEENSAAMAADTIQDFLENGSIVNSVNFPQTRLEPLGVNAAARLCIVNTNTPGVLAKVTSLVSDEGINVVGTVNASRDEIAYTVVDIDKDLSDEKVGQLHDGLLELDGVLTCRFIHQNQEAVYTMHRSLSL
eukprot:g3635.t1